jgi:hypothetical protein
MRTRRSLGEKKSLAGKPEAFRYVLRHSRNSLFSARRLIAKVSLRGQSPGAVSFSNSSCHDHPLTHLFKTIAFSLPSVLKSLLKSYSRIPQARFLILLTVAVHF